MSNDRKLLFREIQRPYQYWWWWLIVLFVAAFVWYAFIQQILFGIPIGDKPAPDSVLIVIWLIFGIAFPIVMLRFVNLSVEVREDGLYVRFMPFHKKYRQFLFNDIDRVESITYESLKRFGGWGIRLNMDGEVAYNISGKQGIELKIKNQTVVIGTKKPEQLLKAIKTAMDSKQRSDLNH